MYDRLLRIKTNTTKEEFNKIVNDLELAYLNSDKINEIHNKEYGFGMGGLDSYYDKHLFRENLKIPALNNTIQHSNNPVDSLTQNLSTMNVNESPYQQSINYIKILVELGRAYYLNTEDGFFNGNERVMVLTSIYILSNHYFDKLEELFKTYTTSSTPEGVIKNNIKFYKGLIQGRELELRQGLYQLITMIFDLNFIIVGNYVRGIDNEYEVINTQDLLYKRLEKSKQELKDTLDRKELRETVANELQAQSKYISLLRDSREILKNILTEIKEDIKLAKEERDTKNLFEEGELSEEDYMSNKDYIYDNLIIKEHIDTFPEGLAKKSDDVTKKDSNEIIFNFIINNIDDEQIEKYFLESLNQQNSKGLNKLIKSEVFKPNNIKLNSSMNVKAEQLFELFKQRGNDKSVSNKLLPENLKQIYEYADINGGYKKKRNKNIKLKYKGGTLSDYLQIANQKKHLLLSQIDENEQKLNDAKQAENADYLQKSNEKKHILLSQIDENEQKLNDAKQAADAAKVAMDMETFLMPPPLPVPPSHTNIQQEDPPALVRKPYKPLTETLLRGIPLPMMPKIEGGRKIPENNNQLQKGGVIYVDNENDQDDFYCPITLEIMEEPTLAEDGFSYERENIEDWFIRKKSNNEPITSPKTGEVMGDKLFPNTTLKNIIQNTRFDREPTSDIHTQTEEKQVDSTQVQTDEKQVDSIDVQTPESIIDETLKENALEIVLNKIIDDEILEEEALDKVSDNMIDEYIGEEMLKTRKSKARDKKKRQKKGKKERDRIEKDKALAEEAIANARNAMPSPGAAEEKDLFYGVEWEQLMNKIGLTKDGNLDEVNSDDIFADFYIVHAEIYAFKYFAQNPGATIKDLMKEKIPHLIHKEAYQIESLFTPDGMIDNDSIKKEIKEWLEGIIEIQDRLLKAGFWEEGQKAEDRFIEEKNRNDSLRKDYNDYKEYKLTERHILNTRIALLSVEMDKKYLGAATKTNNKGEEIGISLFTTSNTTIEQKFQGLFLFWLNCISLTAKMSLQEIKEFVNSPFYKMTVIQMHQLNENLPIELWTFEMVRRGLRVGYICGAAIIAAWVRRLYDFKNNKNKKDEQILKLGKWWSEMGSHVRDGAQKGGVKQKRLKYYPPGFS